MRYDRFLPGRDYLQLKASWRSLLRKVGGPQAAEKITRGDKGRFSRYGSTEDGSFPPVDMVADLEAETGEPVLTRTLADLGGYILIPKPPVNADPIWLRHLSALGKEAGEAIAKVSQALAGDGEISAQEIRDLELRREVREAIEALTSIDQTFLDVLDREEADG